MKFYKNRNEPTWNKRVVLCMTWRWRQTSELAICVMLPWLIIVLKPTFTSPQCKPTPIMSVSLPLRHVLCVLCPFLSFAYSFFSSSGCLAGCSCSGVRCPHDPLHWTEHLQDPVPLWPVRAAPVVLTPKLLVSLGCRFFLGRFPLVVCSTNCWWNREARNAFGCLFCRNVVDLWGKGSTLFFYWKMGVIL